MSDTKICSLSIIEVVGEPGKTRIDVTLKNSIVVDTGSVEDTLALMMKALTDYVHVKGDAAI